MLVQSGKNPHADGAVHDHTPVEVSRRRRTAIAATGAGDSGTDAAAAAAACCCCCSCCSCARTAAVAVTASAHAHASSAASAVIVAMRMGRVCVQFLWAGRRPHGLAAAALLMGKGGEERRGEESGEQHSTAQCSAVQRVARRVGSEVTLWVRRLKRMGRGGRR